MVAFAESRNLLSLRRGPSILPVHDEKRDTRAMVRRLANTSVEIVREVERGHIRHVLFDFDGTLSLIREGWTEVMVAMMVEILLATPRHESESDIAACVRHFVTELTGKQTIYQMIRLAEEVTLRGGIPEDPLAYKHRYLDRLMTRIASRREQLRTRAVSPETMLVPGSLDLLAALHDRGLLLYLASGTDEQFVCEEAELLTLTRFFGPRIYGAVDDYRTYSKAMVIERILRENAIDGAYLLGFGDGYVEIENIKSVGGAAIGVASDEANRSGTPDPWKRTRLLGIGADIIIPDFRESRALLGYLLE